MVRVDANMIAPYVGNLARCGCCGSCMSHTDAGAVCVYCGAAFSQLLVRVDPVLDKRAIGRFSNNAVGDTEHDDNTIVCCIDDTDTSCLRGRVSAICDIGFEDAQPHIWLYDKLIGIWQGVAKSTFTSRQYCVLVELQIMFIY